MKREYSKFRGKKVLVVDDYYVNQEITRGLLELMDIQTDIAESGQIALELHAKNNYDAILMDIQMPEIDGYKVTKEIREREGSDKHTPIIALTANVKPGDREKCLEAGTDDYLGKPIDAEILEKMLLKFLSKKPS